MNGKDKIKVSESSESIKVKYQVIPRKGYNFEQLKKALILGQSIGNPFLRTQYDHTLNYFVPSCAYEDDETIVLEFPLSNFMDESGGFSINYMMSVLMGGQCDIDRFEECRLIDIEMPQMDQFQGPAYGIEGIRKMIGAYDRPLIGGIIKPKIGLSADELAVICKKMADGGVDFIKDDEILNNQAFCPLEERVEKIQKALRGYNVIYAPCVTADDFRFPRQHVRALHMNIHCGLGYFQIMRRHIPYRPALFFQKSGDKVWTTGPFSIDYKVICKLINLIGCDFAHIGMYDGYLHEDSAKIKERQQALGNTLPSFSCGAKPYHLRELPQIFGDDIMITSGGYIHSHPKGPDYAVSEFRYESDKIKQSKKGLAL